MMLLGQNTMDLKECIDMALKNNLSLRAAQLNVLDAQNNVSINNADRIPSLDVGLSQRANFGRSIDQFTNAYISELFNTSFAIGQINIPIFSGFSINNRVKAAKENIKAENLAYEATRNQVTLDVIQAYFQLQAAEEVLQMSSTQLANSQFTLANQTKLLDAGLATRLQEIQLQNLVEQDLLTQLNAQNDIKVARLSLFQTMNLPQEENTTFDKVLLEEFKTELTVSSDKLSNFPQIEQFEYRLRALDYQIKATNGNNLPRLNLNANYNLFYASSNPQRNFVEQLNDTRNGSVGMSLNIPLFNHFITKPQIKRLNIQKQIVENNKDIMSLELQRNIEQAKLLYENAQKSYNLTSKQVSLNKQALDLTEKSLASGTVNINDLLLARTNLETTTSRQIQAKYRAMLQSKILGFYVNGKF
jgi:outer membrane protein